MGGLLLISAALILTLYNVWDADRAARASEDIRGKLAVRIYQTTGVDMEGLEQRQEQEAEKPPLREPEAEAAEEKEPPLYELYPDMPMPLLEEDGNTYIGILEVPDLELSLPVMSELDMDKLKIAPCCYAGSVYSHDIVIAGHNYRKHFNPVKRLPIGTKINFMDVEGNLFLYEIIDMETLNDDAVDAMVTGDWDMTLFTCNSTGERRVAIRCGLLESIPAGEE